MSEIRTYDNWKQTVYKTNTLKLKKSLDNLPVYSQKGATLIVVAKESTCSAGDPGSIPGPGRSAGEGTGYPLQYSWASLVAQLKNLPAIRETWV